jgi:putative endonuclease
MTGLDGQAAILSNRAQLLGVNLVKQYCVYILTNLHNTVLYIGVTSDLRRRILKHKSGPGNEFTKKYLVKKLVYFECGGDVGAAIKREKQIKAGSRQKKIGLVDSLSPLWEDLSDGILG